MVQRVKAKIPGDFLRKCLRPGRLRSANKRPQKVMVLSVIGSDGQKCPIIFFDADENIYRPVYEELLDRPIIPGSIPPPGGQLHIPIGRCARP